ncbi:histidinol-phosphate transaminase [Kyrpidia tusciae]|uniref:Histidinol-phosphate aminotransferase n=1 Tax=Kyrpidia tusciae (strain DSM 2912 / NBRC 15312 / T2) TaxID=562970 RepID=D5WUG8_KYRT2|nr:histidinol-phosphate transaminase [Kyrpidia tusciae]ADG05358.1 histidinol-phosphate aminotransferase [Kyrpidia tusciae DSM 2912]
MAGIIGSRARPAIMGIEPYVPGKPIEEVQREFGLKDVVKLASNENPLGPSPKVQEVLVQAAANLHRYPDGGAVMLRRALAEFYGVPEAGVLMGNGSDELIKLIAESFVEPGDEVIVPSPSFSEYWFATQVMAGRTVAVPLDERFQYNPERILEAVTARTKLMYLCTPNNPTGTYIPEKTLTDLVRRVPDHVLVVLDEAYHEYVEAEDYGHGLPLLREGAPVVVLRTFSKLYALAALRVGYALADPEIIQVINRVREPFNVNAVAQAAAVAALGDEEHRRKSFEVNRAGKRQLYEGLEALGCRCVPTEANFILVEVPHSSTAVFESLLRRGVIVRDGAAFGLPRYLRISIGTEADNARLLEEMAEVFRTLDARPAGLAD